jgi:acyl-coenzyme A thioesterase PaaI-like protein
VPEASEPNAPSSPPPSPPPSAAPFSAERRVAVERLARAMRDLGDVVVETAVDPGEIDAAVEVLDELTERLGRVRDTTYYSGLVPPGTVPTQPQNPMPLNPIIGACSPVRPDVDLWFDGTTVRGTATISKRFIGPPGHCHGGISAMISDQVVTASPMPHGWRCITRSLHVDYRRALPLGRPLTIVGECHEDDAGVRATASIAAGDKVCVTAEARLVHYERLAEREGLPGGRRTPR